MAGKTMWSAMIEWYGRENLQKMTLEQVLEIAWFVYNNPIKDERIKQVFVQAGLEKEYNDLWFPKNE